MLIKIQNSLTGISCGNKYLAHIIVKGINDDFGGIILFYTLLNKHNKKLKNFIEQDKKDA